jgi:menaquinone-dependent protoporphyrinogen oxidase
MEKLLIVYGTGEGQTAKVARRMAARARAKGYEVDAFQGNKLPAGFSLAGYRAALIGASVHLNRYQRYMAAFVKKRQPELQAIPSALFLVCLAARGRTAKDRERTQRYIATFLRKTGWQPGMIATFAGALPFSQYGWYLKLHMKIVMRLAEPQLALGRDYEFTDWDAVDRFTDTFLASLQPAPAEVAPQRVPV